MKFCSKYDSTKNKEIRCTKFVQSKLVLFGRGEGHVVKVHGMI